MVKIKFDNWRDQRGSELERAKKIIADKNINLNNLSKLTRIPYQGLRYYSQDLNRLDKAGWKRINVLAQAWDINMVQTTMNQQDDIKKFLEYLSKMFETWLKDASRNPQKVAIINRMRTIILSDPVAVVELFKARNQISKTI